MIELVEVTKDYGEAGTATRLNVLKGINLKVDAGRSLVIVGPSGCGKSTLLNIMGGLDHPTSGQVCFDGRDLATVDDHDLAKIRNRDIGFVFQLHHLLPQCTVLENVLIPTLAGREGLAGRAARDRAKALLERVGLKNHMAHRPGELSGGQRQRVAVARALINQPKLLLADEPTGSLDETTSDGIADLLIQLNRDDGVTLVVVTHSPKLASRLGSVVGLHDGRLKDGNLS